MIGIVNRMLSAGVDGLMRPLRTESPWPGMLALSLLAAVVVLTIVKLTANAAEVRRRRDRMVACILEMALFRDDPVLTLDALRRALVANGVYLRKLILPLLAGLIPMVLLTGQVHDWLAYRPLRPEETATVTARVASSVDLMTSKLQLRTAEAVSVGSLAVSVDSEAVRAPRQGEISWRIRARREGAGLVKVEIAGREFEKTIVVGRKVARNPKTRGGGLAGRLLYPSEPPLPADGLIRSITVGYSPQEFRIGNVGLNWLAAFLLCSLLFAGLLMRPMRVTI
jgi:hypothetical protein